MARRSDRDADRAHLNGGGRFSARAASAYGRVRLVFDRLFDLLRASERIGLAELTELQQNVAAAALLRSFPHLTALEPGGR